MPLGDRGSQAYRWTRKIPLDGPDSSFAIPASSDWLNPLPAVPPLGSDVGAYSDVRLEEFIVAAIAAFSHDNTNEGS